MVPGWGVEPPRGVNLGGFLILLPILQTSRKPRKSEVDRILSKICLVRSREARLGMVGHNLLTGPSRSLRAQTETFSLVASAIQSEQKNAPPKIRQGAGAVENPRH